MLGLSMGQFDPDSTTKREYQKSTAVGDLGATAAKSSDQAKQNKLTTTQAGPAINQRGEDRPQLQLCRRALQQRQLVGRQGVCRSNRPAAKRKGKKTSNKGSGGAEKKQKKVQVYDKAVELGSQVVCH